MPDYLFDQGKNKIQGLPKTAIDAIDAELQDVKEQTTENVVVWNDFELDYSNGYYYYVNGAYTSDSSRLCSKFEVDAGQKYSLTTFIRSALISGIIFFNEHDEVISHDLDGTGTENYVVDYEFVVPEGAQYLAVQSSNNTTLSLKIGVDSIAFAGYTKEEVNAKLETSGKYGVKWNLANPDDLGTRMFDAIGLTARIGIGQADGYSDFDNIFPWSEMKRCNIKLNANGAPVVTFEGEAGFALDGTNGDVFVRIPKFAYERYIKDGYEYRIISRFGTCHPAFVENGKELDEIFISAFEGFIDANNKLRSIAGVIPSNNQVGQTFLNAAQANGTNYSLYDSRCVDLLFSLMSIEYCSRNTNSFLGYGLADFEQPATYSSKNMITTSATDTNTVRTAKWSESQKQGCPVGSNITVCKETQQEILTQAKITSCVDDGNFTDWTFDGDPITVDTTCFIGSAPFTTNFCETAPVHGNNIPSVLSWHTGRTNWYYTASTDTRNAIRYRWIENIFGNVWQFLPDISFNGLQMYVCKNMVDYVMHKITAPYYPQGLTFVENTDNGEKADITGANYWITKFDDNIFTRGIPFGRTYDKSLTSKKAFGAYYYLKNDNVCIVNGGGYDHLYRCNVLTLRAWILSTNKWYLYGARMMFKQIN